MTTKLPQLWWQKNWCYYVNSMSGCWWKNESNHTYLIRNSVEKLVLKFFGLPITNFYLMFLYCRDLITDIDIDSAYFFHKGYKGDMFYILGKDFWIEIEWIWHKKLIDNGMKQKCFLLVQYVIPLPLWDTSLYLIFS